MLWNQIQQYSTILYILTHATIFSWLEVEMEGKHGWAVNLPTSCAFGGWTWYHIAMNMIVLLTIAGCTQLYDGVFKWNYSKYVATGVLYVFRVAVWFCVEDIMWFVINAQYGIRRYTKNDVFWHADKIWFLGTILLNWIVLIAAIGIGFIELISTNKTTVFRETLTSGLYLCACCLLSLAFTYKTSEETPNKSQCLGSHSTIWN